MTNNPLATTTPKRTNNQRYYLGAAAVILATLAGIAVAYPQLPNIVPIHWDIEGHVNGWGPKWSLFLYGPGLMAFIVLMFSALPWLSPKKFEVDSFRATYLYIMIVTVALLAYCQLLILISALGFVVDVSRALEGGVCLLIALLGNVMGKVRRNFFVGIRTPWTIANEQVWNATHRFAAKTLFAGGMLGLVAVTLRAPFWLPMTAILVGALVPAFYSLIFYKQLERRGELN
jgi:uncharacterized membrane protein